MNDEINEDGNETSTEDQAASKEETPKADAPKAETPKAAAPKKAKKAKKADKAPKAKKDEAPEPDDGTIEVTVTESEADPLPIFVNGRGLLKLHIGKKTKVPAEALDALNNGQGIAFEVHGQED